MCWPFRQNGSILQRTLCRLDDRLFPHAKPYDAAAGAGYAQRCAQGASRGTGAGHRGDFQIEADKLKSLREALWTAFEAGPAAGLPNTLIDLTLAYTSTLRLQLNLRAIEVRAAAPKPKVAPHLRTEPRPRE